MTIVETWGNYIVDEVMEKLMNKMTNFALIELKKWIVNVIWKSQIGDELQSLKSLKIQKEVRKCYSQKIGRQVDWDWVQMQYSRNCTWCHNSQWLKLKAEKSYF